MGDAVGMDNITVDQHWDNSVKAAASPIWTALVRLGVVASKFQLRTAISAVIDKHMPSIDTPSNLSRIV